MKLYSCEGCGLVFDLDKISFPYGYDRDTMEEIDGELMWSRSVGRMVPFISCPVCESPILKED